ncbi:MAG: hypothetical protein ACR2P5_00320 [Gammaproteobacteria bacterium]
MNPAFAGLENPPLSFHCSPPILIGGEQLISLSFRNSPPFFLVPQFIAAKGGGQK